MKQLNPVTIAWKIKRKSERLSLYLLHKARARLKPTYSDKDWKGWGKLRLSSPPIYHGSYDKIITWAEEVLKHTFDLLGSGKVRVHYGLDAKGFEGYKYPPLKVDFEFDDKGKWLVRFINKANLSYLQKVWRFLRSINPSYKPIDWQLDFKSGYRWDNNKFYMDIRYGNKPGADVKVPWELSRFQHLSALAIAYKVTRDDKYALEYVSQILDWIATNPPMFGVNWKCTMDVAIRVANWLFWFGCIKDWIDRQEWKEKFYRIFLNSLYDHLRFIPKNLEWSPMLTTNHYLSDIAGLLILASSIEEIFPESERLMRFAIEELKKEMFKQVYPDGTDFEASTCYHRLVLEIFFYPVWWEVVHHGSFNGENYREVAEEIFGKAFVNRLYKMFDAVLYLLKPNGRMPQIGDNDSGQFIKLYPREVLDMRYLLALGAVFFKESKFKVKDFFQTDEDVAEIEILYGKRGLDIWNKPDWAELMDIESKIFPYSGWYVMRNNRDYCIISCGSNGQNGIGGHAHNDKLSFELCIRNRTLVVDPGTYIYTADPFMRNLLRSTIYHNTVVIDGKEQNNFNGNEIFQMPNNAAPEVNRWETTPEYDFLDVQHSGYERLAEPILHRRRIIFNKNELYFIIRDMLLRNSKFNVKSRGLNSEHHFDLYFHLAPVVATVDVEDRLVVRCNFSDIMMMIVPVGTDALKVNVEKGWISCGYGIKEQAYVIKYSKTCQLPTNFTFILFPFQTIRFITSFENIMEEALEFICEVL